MSSEIVPTEGPSDRPERTSSMPSLRWPRTPQDAPEPFDSEKVPSTLVSEVHRVLRVANLIESESSRDAYLCRFHAFEKTHMKDPHSTRPLGRLEQIFMGTKPSRCFLLARHN